MQSAYETCLNKLYGLRRFGIKPGLARIRELLAHIGNPQQAFSCIHIAGTNGKGSIASALSRILYESGYCVGLYTSPHLIRFNERIQINGEPISDDTVLEAFRAVSSGAPPQATFFEYTTAMAFYAFSQSRVQWAVVETGLGGRLDATNILSPALSIISNISMEHQAYLGRTISQIASEKAGIIKPHTPVITGARQAAAIRVMEKIAFEKSAPFYRFGSDFQVRRKNDGRFTYLGIQTIWPDMQTSLIGEHQVDNAALALAACEVLILNGVGLDIACIRKALSENIWPGRLEMVSDRPMVVLDGAHNLAASRKLGRYLATAQAGKNITLVIGILDDKPYAAMLRNLLPLCRKVILTRPAIDRALDPEKLHRIVKDYPVEASVIPDVARAVQAAISAAELSEVVCITGSLYVVGEARAYFLGCRERIQPI